MIKDIVKTAAAIDVSAEYKEKTGNNKPFYLSQRFIGLIVGILCSTILSKYALPADKISSAVNLIIGNWDALTAAFGAIWSIILIIKGAFQQKNRTDVQKKAEAVITEPAPQQEDTSARGLDGNP